MKRPKQHDIDTDAKRIFLYKVQSKTHYDGRFIVREQGNDYGIDYEVELFSKGKSTGSIFKVQLKGQEKVKNSRSRKFKKFNNFPLKTIEYLLEQVEIPSFIVLVNTSSEDVYWLDVHSNDSLIQNYNKAKDKRQKSLTLYIPKDNLLPESKPHLMEAFNVSLDRLALRRVSKIQSIDYSEYVRNLKSEDIDPELFHLQEKIEITRLTQAVNFLNNSQPDQAKIIIDSIIENSDYSPDSKFQATLFLEKIYLQTISYEQYSIIDKINFYLELSEQLTRIAHNVSLNLKRYAEMFDLTSKMALAVHDDFQLYLNWKMHVINAEEFGVKIDPISELGLHSARKNIAFESQKMIVKANELIEIILDEGHFEILPDLLYTLLAVLSRFSFRLSLENMADAKALLIKFVDSVFYLGSTISTSLPIHENKDYHLANYALAYLSFINPENPEEKDVKNRMDRAKELISRMENEEEKIIASQDLNDGLKEIDKAKIGFSKQKDYDPKIPPDWDALESFYKTQAMSMGIDLALADKEIEPTGTSIEDINARVAWIISVGINDLNPNRVLRNCKHLYVEYGAGGVGVPAQMMNLPSAGVKNILCMKHFDHGLIQGLELYNLYSIFENKYCSSCKNSSPRDDTWEYTEAWDNQQKKKLEKMR